MSYTNVETQKKMKKEELKSLGRDTLLALIVGPLVGILEAVFGRVLGFVLNINKSNFNILVPFLPLAGLLIIYMYNRYSKQSLKGMTIVFEAGQRKRDNVPLAIIPLAMAGTWITHLFGGSAGREGVAVQIGASLSHNIGKKLGFKTDGRILLVTGMAAGFAGLFQTPITAIFFAMEVITTGIMDYEALLPATVAAFLSCFTASLFGIKKSTFDISNAIALTPVNVGKLIILGVAFGIAGTFFSIILSKSKKFFADKFPNQYKKIFFMGIILAVFLFLTHGRYSGVGSNLVIECFGDGNIYAYDWLLKLVFTAFTLAIGFQGGEVTPLFTAGSCLGYVLGGLLGLPPVACAAFGYAAVFGSGTNTLLAAIFIEIEVFGSADMLPAIIICIIAYMINGNKSIYSAQQNFWIERKKEKTEGAAK